MRLDLPQRTTQAALRGELDLDDPVLARLPHVPHDPGWEAVRLRHCLSMTVGHDVEAWPRVRPVGGDLLPGVLALPLDHPLAEQEVVSMTDLTDEDWIAGCPRCRGHLLQLAHDAGFAPRVAFETEDYVAVQGFVAAGLGVALIPDLIREATRNDDVVIRPLDPQSHRHIHVVTTEDLAKVPTVAATLDALCEVARAAAGVPA